MAKQSSETIYKIPTRRSNTTKTPAPSKSNLKGPSSTRSTNRVKFYRSNSQSHDSKDNSTLRNQFSIRSSKGATLSKGNVFSKSSKSQYRIPSRFGKGIINEKSSPVLHRMKKKINHKSNSRSFFASAFAAHKAKKLTNQKKRAIQNSANISRTSDSAQAWRRGSDTKYKNTMILETLETPRKTILGANKSSGANIDLLKLQNLDQYSEQLSKIEEPRLGDMALQEVFEIYKDLRFYLEDRVRTKLLIFKLANPILGCFLDSEKDYFCRHSKYEGICPEKHVPFCGNDQKPTQCALYQ